MRCGRAGHAESPRGSSEGSLATHEARLPGRGGGTGGAASTAGGRTCEVAVHRLLAALVLGGGQPRPPAANTSTARLRRPNAHAVPSETSSTRSVDDGNSEASRQLLRLGRGSCKDGKSSSTPRTASRPSPSSSTGAHSCSPRTSCSVPTARRRLPRLHRPGRRAGRLARPPEPPRRDADLLLAGADRAVDRVQAADGLAVPYVSTYNTDFAFDFGLARRRSRCSRFPSSRKWSTTHPIVSRNGRGRWGRDQGRAAREPAWIAFARENGTVYHTYTVMAPDPFVPPYFSFLLERTPKPHPHEREPRAWRKDEYPD